MSLPYESSDDNKKSIAADKEHLLAKEEQESKEVGREGVRGIIPLGEEKTTLPRTRKRRG